MKDISGNKNLVVLSRLDGDSISDINIKYENSNYNTEPTSWQFPTHIAHYEASSSTNIIFIATENV